MDDSMESLMKKLPLSENIKGPLVDEKGALADYLKLVVSYEKGEWDKVTIMANTLGMKEEELPDYYMDALGWADNFTFH